MQLWLPVAGIWLLYASVCFYPDRPAAFWAACVFAITSIAYRCEVLGRQLEQDRPRDTPSP